MAHSKKKLAHDQNHVFEPMPEAPPYKGQRDDGYENYANYIHIGMEHKKGPDGKPMTAAQLEAFRLGVQAALHQAVKTSPSGKNVPIKPMHFHSWIRLFP